MPPRTLTHYRILEQIGVGGMGVVYRAHDEQLERDVAIKVLPPGALADENMRKRFRKEALSLAKLNHPNVATIFEFASAEDVDFLVTEYIAGATLDEKLASGALAAKDVLSLGAQLTDGLAAAHAQGIVHRDLKPSNLRITPDGRLKILDFGLAQLMPHASELGLTATVTRSQEVTGTLPYMAPEQLRGEATDARADVWSVGVVLYEMATGKRPFPETNGPLLIDAILNRAPEAPSKVNAKISPGLERVILKALDKDSAQRYQTAAALGSDLERLTAGVRPLARKRRKRNRGIELASAVLLLALGMVGGLAWLRHRTVTITPRQAENAVKTRRSVAVLGFKNLTGKPEAAWISTALSEMLTTELAAGGQLMTVPGESVAEMKKDLSLPEADSYGQETLAKIRENLGSDSVVLGSYLALGGDQLRVDMKLQDATTGQIVDSVTEAGTEAQLSDLISNAGNVLRIKLGVGATSEAQAAEVKASMPANTEAARYYAEGLEKLRAYDALAAKDLLEKAANAEPDFAPGRAALATAWRALGYNAKAAEEAKKAVDLSGALEREQKLLIEGQSEEIAHQWDKAIDNYRTLFQFFPDNLEYGLRLATAETYGSKPQEALATLEQLRKLPAPAKDDPRIEIADAYAASLLGDYKRQLASATRGFEKAQAQGARLQAGRALLMQGKALDSLGQPKDGAAKLEAAEKIFAEAGNQDMAAVALNSLGISAFGQGDMDAARKSYEGALEKWRDVGDGEKVASALGNLGQILKRQGDLKKAVPYYQQSLETFREVGNKNSYAIMLGNLGNLQNASGELGKAKATLEQAIAATREMGDRDDEESNLINLSDVVLSQGDVTQAAKLLDEAEPLLQATGDKSDLVDSRLARGNVLLETGDVAGARAKYQEAAAIALKANARDRAATAMCAVGNADIELGHAANVEAPCRAAITEFQSEGDTQDEINVRAVLIRALLAQGKIEDARAEAEAAKTLALKSQNADSRLGLAAAVGRLQAAVGDPAAAEKLLQDALAEAARLGFVNHQFELRLALGEIEMKSGKTAAGRARLTALQKDAAAKGFNLIAEKARRALS
jgi:eukaryotic-like serine/threonine-protein kinase